MLKKSFENRIKKLLPDEVNFRDESGLNILEDEFLALLPWLKLYKIHFEKSGFNDRFCMTTPIISKRLHLDFGLVNILGKGKFKDHNHSIYLCTNDLRLDPTILQLAKTFVD